ncbi:MAG: hypothetical protein JWM59_1049 [Verrucomicrobiales bacterium]|nr:hypothetical protein [Verrucomicrobiales bacterium]
MTAVIDERHNAERDGWRKTCLQALKLAALGSSLAGSWTGFPVASGSISWALNPEG